MNENSEKKFIVVHAGRRDDYQIALALNEKGFLKYLVTEFYSPFDSYIGKKLCMNRFLKNILLKRYKNGLSSKKVLICYKALWYFILFNITKNIKFDNLKGLELGKKANLISKKYSIPVLSMNTYATEAFKNNPINPKILFQFHPHPNFVKHILQEEININPKAKESLIQEYEFSIPDKDLKELSEEVWLATNYICASTVTKKSLISVGVDENKIKVIPYGVDLSRYPYLERTVPNEKFKVIFIGSLNQRKGITYLLDALNKLVNVSLNIVGRGIFDYNLLDGYSYEINVFQNVSHEKLVELLHISHCFVLPSIIEGFGQVILEAMSTGIPVISTDNTAAADIITNGKDGFIVPVRNVTMITDIIEQLQNDHNYCLKIGYEAHNTASQFTWKLFRQNIVNYTNLLTK
jgi:glycosyltransferase involved in cell wall biosynthesis